MDNNASGDSVDSWFRQCALCGSCDAEHAWPEPADDGSPWECPRCAAIRWLWRPSDTGPRQRRTG